MDNESIQAIIDFWFVQHGPGDWFAENPDFDEAIRQNFLTVYEQLSKSGLPEHWRQSAQGYLAAILVLDQFPRNLFRQQPRAFATDAQALELAREAVTVGLDRELPETQRVFVYMPFQHSEVLADQQRSCELFRELGNDYYTDYAVRHLEVIQRFGRFPHRNAILGRENTVAEQAYLAQPGSGF